MIQTTTPTTRIPLHPQTVAKLVRRIKLLCPEHDYTGVNSGWLVGGLEPSHMVALMKVKLHEPHPLDYERYGEKQIETMRTEIQSKIAQHLSKVRWVSLKRGAKNDSK